MEAPLHAYTRRIRGLESLPYWERLARGMFLSNERWQDKYRILYWTGPQLWDHCGLHQRVQERFTLAVPSITGTRKAIKSFLVEGPKLFNSLTRDLRNLDCKLGTLKAHLDSYLETQPPPAASLEP